MALRYVDDVILSSTNELKIHKVNKYLDDEFRIKVLWSLNYFLEIEVVKMMNRLVLN